MRKGNYLLRSKTGVHVFEPKKQSPVILTVPHDGEPFQNFKLLETRKTGYRGRDRCVWAVTQDILEATQASAVRGLMPRSLIDYNRAWPEGINYYPNSQKGVHTALDDEILVPMYRNYHDEIDRLICRSLIEFGAEKTLVMDLHGFTNQPPYAPDGGYDLILGTGNRISIPHGYVDEDFANHMTSKGYKVFLPTSLSLGPEEDWYSADFTTRHHSEKHGINVIQVEIASRFREKGARAIGQRLSRDIADFISSFSA